MGGRGNLGSKRRQTRWRRLPYVARRLIPAAVAGAVVAALHLTGGGAEIARYVDSISALSPRAAAQPIEGRATVIDGDTIEISGQRIRFNGIDAPESAQYCEDAKGFEYPCGRIAANALDEFLAASRPARCEFVSWDQYGRYVGDCARADGASVQAWLVVNGHALDWPRYSGGAYAAQQAAAQQARRGIWDGTFQAPWEWRAARRGNVEQQPAGFSLLGGSGCTIKGNISAKGERIYHMPGQKYYAQTRISESKGERWFCSEEEARQAGWRKARQ